jgi:hypothetical protein
VTLRKRSCPAVSQIWSFILQKEEPSELDDGRLMIVDENSTPMV